MFGWRIEVVGWPRIRNNGVSLLSPSTRSTRCIATDDATGRS